MSPAACAVHSATAMQAPSYELARCPVCGGADFQEVAGADDITKELEALWEFHTPRLRPDTPPEHLADRVAFSQRPPIRVVECNACGLVYRNPRERAWMLRDLYAREAPERVVLQSLFETQRASYAAQAERLTQFAGRSGTGLEAGSYVGAFLAAARDAGWRFEGVDVNEATNSFAREQGFRVTTGDLDSINRGRRFDAVAIWNCFDQLPEPRAAARRARALLAPGGTLAIRVPNGAFYAGVRKALEGLTAPVARALLAHNNLLGFPYRHGFTPASLATLLESAGFRVEREQGDALVPIADEWTRWWAMWEERAVKGILRALSRSGLAADAAPWFEAYARAV